MEIFVFIFLGIINSIAFSIFGIIFTDWIDNKILRTIVAVTISCVLGFGLIKLIETEGNNDKTIWNNGYCICGGEWKLVDVNSRIPSCKTYYYQCSYCDSLFETNYKFE